MNIKSEILNYALATKGKFFVEDSEEENSEDPVYYVYFNDDTIDVENAIKVNEDDDQVTVYTTSKHDFNNGLGFMVNISSTRDKECAIMICEALNNLKEIYTKSQS